MQCYSPQSHRGVNTLRSRQNGRHFADDTFKRIFLNENVLISIKISLKFVPKGPINNIPALVSIMALRRPGDRPLSEPRMVSLPTHICVTRPQWVKTLRLGQNDHDFTGGILKFISCMVFCDWFNCHCIFLQWSVRQIWHIPHCTCPTSHNAPFRTKIWTLWDRRINMLYFISDNGLAPNKRPATI